MIRAVAVAAVEWLLMGFGAGLCGSCFLSEVVGADALVNSGAGVSSTFECFPVVHGGMDRNSSNVKTRGLQHFQPRPQV